MIDAALALVMEALEGYEERTSQKEMAQLVADTFESGGTSLVEAGTGTGKSLAYLIPAILNAVASGKRTVISTHTINLQEQLINKDIPFLLRALKADISAVLVKGMGNYACKRKAADAGSDKALLKPHEVEQIEQIEGWIHQTDDGTRSGLPFVPTRPVWERIGVEYDACGRGRCPFYKECFFFKARKKAEDAHILVVNHHILLADLSLKQEMTDDEAGILPEYDHLIIDEAHHLEEVATAVFAEEVSRAELVRQLERLATEKKIGGKLQAIAQREINKSGVEELLKRLQIDLPAQKRRLVTEINELFHQLMLFFDEEKTRLGEHHLEHPKWNEIGQISDDLIRNLSAFAQSLQALHQDLDFLEESVRIDVTAIAGRLERLSVLLNDFVFGEFDPSSVKWIESERFNLKLVKATLDVSALLRERLFNSIPAVVLTSATLTTGGNFSFIRTRLGLDGMEVNEAQFPSLFDFEEQVLFGIPNDMPPPQAPTFQGRAVDAIREAVLASEGGAFVLFTSFRMLLDCYDILKDQIPFPVMRQGEKARRQLLEDFRENANSVLFGTDSFWEGVDVIGDGLRLVVIAKLPFRVPTEPIVQARCQALEEEGQNAFFDYTVPAAIVKFKQGMGRLIRHRQDRGCVLCLDSRLLSKPYGKLFLRSLPECKQVFESQQVVNQALQGFYSASLTKI